MKKIYAVKVLVDMWGCLPTQLGNDFAMNTIVRHAIEMSQLKLIHHTYQRFGEVGKEELMLVVIVTSGIITLHSFIDNGYMSIDVCLGGDFNPMQVMDNLIERIAHEDYNMQFISRGY